MNSDLLWLDTNKHLEDCADSLYLLTFNEEEREVVRKLLIARRKREAEFAYKVTVACLIIALVAILGGLSAIFLFIN